MHIVIFTGGKAPAPAVARAFFQRHKADFVIAADSGLDTLARYERDLGEGFAPNAILGDMDSLADKALLTRYPAATVQTFPADKDWSDTELALELAHRRLSERGETRQRQITLVGAGGGRIDHLLAVFDLFATPLRPDVWLTPCQALWYAGAGSRFELAGLRLSDVVSVVRTSRSRTGGCIRSDGLEWEWKAFRSGGMPSLSNRISRARYEAQKPVTLSVQEGDFVLIVPLGAEVQRTKAHGALSAYQTTERSSAPSIV